jgi:hypothetical protein
LQDETGKQIGVKKDKNKILVSTRVNISNSNQGHETEITNKKCQEDQLLTNSMSTDEI